MDAASEVVTIPASDATLTTAHKTTDTFNVNQSNNSIHTHTNAHSGSNSLLSKIAGNVISHNSLNIGASSNSNSSCSSSSTSSNSSGYGSSTTTPTNNYDLQNTTPTTTPVPTSTTVANTEHIIPVATVAAVTPFFNEAITTHNLDTQRHHHLHHAQQSQEPLQQQQQHHMLQTHHQQYSQSHLQANLQHHQYLPRQQYYSPYDYQQPTPTQSLSAPSVTTPVAPYNMIIPGPYEMSSSNVAQAFGTSQYKPLSSTYERSSPLMKTNVTACTQPLQQQHVEQQQPKMVNQHFSGLLGSTKSRSSSSFISNSTSTNTSKPQAMATPFYANPLPFYDNYKHKLPLEYPDSYSNSSAAGATAATYHQQQKYYAAAKSQLKEASYGSPAGFNSKPAYANTSNIFPGSAGGLNLSSTASYDKYMYPHAAPTAYTATGHLGNETPPEVSNYRKPVMGSNMNSPSWPWGIEYASGSSRSIPPPPASHIPTATVAPTHATHLTQTPPVLAREPFYVPHDKYVGKYDKYSTPSYPQTYVSPPTNRHLWSNTPHAPSLAQFGERHLLASGPPPPPPHASAYFSSNHNTSLNSRQACCSQPYQSQSCYYPVSHPVQPRLSHPQNSSVAPPPSGCLPGQQTLGSSPHLNALSASCKYGGVYSDYGNANKMKTSNDLYLNSHPYDIAPPAHNFGYATAHSSQQLYNTNAHQSMAHGVTPPSLLTNDPFNVNPTSYANDLNLTTSNFDNYHTHLDNHPSQQTLTGIHSTPQPPPTYGPTVAKRALLDFRKPIQPQPPPTIPADCYSSLTPRDHYNQHELLNTPETTTATFNEYQLHQRSANDQLTEVPSDSVAIAEESTKNLSLRDFIANWNDDEDEYQNSEEVNFDESAVLNEVLQTAPLEQQKVAAEVVTIQEVKVIKPATQLVPEHESISGRLKTAEVSSVLLSDTEASQYVNLPDIVIDVKKSNNGNSSITTPTTSPALSPPHVEATDSCLNLTDFDVEKELDELNLKRPLQQEATKEINNIKNTDSVNTPQISPDKNINGPLNFEDFNLEPTGKTVLKAMATQLTTHQGSELSEQYLKDIEGYESSSSSRHSNESAFEKEYETFINKITSESTGPTKPWEPKTIEAGKEVDFDKNVQDFSKFYKRKRKLKEDGLKNSATANRNKKKMKTIEATKTTQNNSNFPQAYTKICRKRLLQIKRRQTHKHKPLSAFYRAINFIRHQGPQRKRRVREFMLELRDKHLPLIKRQSIKNYAPYVNENMLMPKTLKALCIMVFNTEEFRKSFCLARDQQQDNCLESAEKHLCTDPTCETCEVIKSLMETGNFEAALLRQTADPTTIYCTEVTKEAITILDDLPATDDLNFHNGETIIISNTIEDDQYVQENLSELITKSVLSENVVLAEPLCPSVQMEIEQNIHANNQTEMVLQTAFDNFETNFSETDQAETQAQTVLSQPEAAFQLKTSVPLQPTQLLETSAVQPVEEISFCENLELKPMTDDSSLRCDSKACDKSNAESFSEDKSLEVQKLHDSGEKVENKSRLLNNSLKSNSSDESDTEDSSSSDSEYESSSSDTDDKSTKTSYRKRSSSSESSNSEKENDLEEQEVCTLRSQQSKEEEKKPKDGVAIQKEEADVSENNVEEKCCFAQTSTAAVSATKIFDKEKSPNSPQRIVIRITKCFSPNEQSLRVENISAKPLQRGFDHTENGKEDGEDIKKVKTDVLSTQQETFDSDRPIDKQSDSDHAEDVNTEKKLVTPLKLVLRGKEYLRVKTVKKSLKMRTQRNSNTESESENEKCFKRKSKLLKLSKTQEREDAKASQKSKLKGNSDKETAYRKLSPEKIEEPFEKCHQQDELEANLEKLESKDKTTIADVSHIDESTDGKPQESEAVAHITLPTKSDSKSENVAEHDAMSIALSQEFNQLGDNGENKDNPLETFAPSSPLQSPKEDDNEDVSQLVFLQDSEVEKAISFAVVPKTQNEFVAEISQKPALELIESYSLTDSSEEDTEIHSLSDSASCNIFEYDTNDDDEFFKSSNCTISKPIVISDDDSLEGAAEIIVSKVRYSKKIFVDHESKVEVTDVAFSKTSPLAENNEWSLSNSQYDITKGNSECSRSSTELHHVPTVFDATKNESQQDISDCSYSSEVDLDEEISSRLNLRKPQEKEENEKCLSVSSPGNSKEAFPAKCLENTIPKESTLENIQSENCNQPISDSYLAENNEISLYLTEKQTEKDKLVIEVNIEAAQETTKQICELQTKTEENQIADYTRGKHCLQNNLGNGAGKHRPKCTPNELVTEEEVQITTPVERSPVTGEDDNLSQKDCPKIAQLSLQEAVSEETTENSYSSQRTKVASTKISQSLADSLENAEKTIIQDNDESCSSGICSPTLLERSYTPEELVALTESHCGQIYLSTKTKAAYKSYDLKTVIQEEDLSDSETESPCSKSQNLGVDSNEMEEDYRENELIDDNANESPFAGVSSENGITRLEEDDSLKSTVDQPNVSDEAVKNVDLEEAIESPIREVLDEQEDIEDNIDQTVKKVDTTSSEETKSQNCTPEDFIAICSKNISTDSITDSSLIKEAAEKLQQNEEETEAIKYNVHTNISSHEINEPANETTLKLGKDLDYEEKTKGNSENFCTIEYLNNASGPSKPESLNISQEIKKQSVTTENESKSPNIYSDCRNSDTIEGCNSTEMETLDPENKIQVVGKDSEIKSPETTSKAHVEEPAEDSDVLIENMSKSATEELSTTKGKTAEEDIIKTMEMENKSEQSSEPIQMEESSELILPSDATQLSADTNQENIAEVKVERAKTTPITTEPLNAEGGLFQSSVVERNAVELKQVQEVEENILKEISTPSYKTERASQVEQTLEETSTADNTTEEAIEEKEPVSESATEAEGISITSFKKYLTSKEDMKLSKANSTEEGNDETNEEANIEEYNLKENIVSPNETVPNEINRDIEEITEVLESETKDKSRELEGSDLEKGSSPIDSSSLIHELNQLSKGLNSEEKSSPVSRQSVKLTDQEDLKESCILPNEKLSLFEDQNISNDVAKENATEEKFARKINGREAGTETEDPNSEENLISNNETTPIFNEGIQIIIETEHEEEKHFPVNLNQNQKTPIHEPFSQEGEDQNLKKVLQPEEALGVCNVTQDCVTSNEVLNRELKPDNEEPGIENAKVVDTIEKPEDSEETSENDQQAFSPNDNRLRETTDQSAFKSQEENSHGNAEKPCITPDELSVEFYGFKNQSSFEEESEDFHGFEDLEEVARIRQEIENVNDDSAANDGFLTTITLDRAMHKTSTTSLADSMTSEINEMEALEKELSQHQLDMEVTDDDKDTEKEYQTKKIKIVSTNDIEHIKQMLESDEEPQNEGENKPAMMTHYSKDKSVENKNIIVSNDRLSCVSSIIPKLSDLCRAALNSSLNSSSNLIQQQTTVLVERELSVEEALAEMYRQAGVLLSDSEDCDNEVPTPDDTEGHDVLLINLQEILNSDNNDVYVLQCDMNENILNAVQSSEQHEEESPEIEDISAERVNTVQIILDTQNAEPQIHIISSDSESEVIILSDDESEINYRRFKAREDNITIPFINDEEINNGDDNLFDISTIHHEEIVPDNLAKFLRDEFYKYLHEKYVQRSISKYYHAHKVLKKYKRIYLRRQ